MTDNTKLIARLRYENSEYWVPEYERMDVAAVMSEAADALEAAEQRIADVDLLIRERDQARAERNEAREVIAGGPHVTAKHWGKLQHARARLAELEAEVKALENSVQNLSRLHEVATERTVGLAAVIEQARNIVTTRSIVRETNVCIEAAEILPVLASADTDAALREVRATNRAAVIQGLIDCYYAGDKNTFARRRGRRA